MFNSKRNQEQSHRNSYVWFNMDSFGVCGVPPEEVKQLIIRWNRSNFWRYGVDWWQWFSAMIGEDVHCFSVLWNEGNPSMVDLPIIKNNG